jgi:Fe2+ or Zn2+ uptake regulation protein
MRYSRQRHLVQETLQKSHSHLSADQIYRMVKSVDSNISIATVYRNLNQLCEMGEIMKLNVPDAAGYFDGNSKAHFHMQCEQCGNIVDIPENIIPDINHLVNRATHFKITKSQLFFRGICLTCTDKDSEPEIPARTAGEE